MYVIFHQDVISAFAYLIGIDITYNNWRYRPTVES